MRLRPSPGSGAWPGAACAPLTARLSAVARVSADANRLARPVDSWRCRPTAGGIAALAQSVRATHS